MIGELSVIKPGLHTSIQDLGRSGLLKYGVPSSGVLDRYAAKVANLLLRNNADDAVLEITVMGPKLKFNHPTKIAISGANLSPKLNDKLVDNNKVHVVDTGDVLSFGQKKEGARSYLSVFGGFKTEGIFGSKSWYEGITSYGRLAKGSILNFETTTNDLVQTHSSIIYENMYLKNEQIEVFPGPEYHKLDRNQQLFIENQIFHIGKNNNRMAYQLEEVLLNNLEPIITGGVLPGTIQLTPSGKLIILMRDCQTTGGYPRILQVSESSLCRLAQKFTTDKIRFIVK
ncbi:biotin-dependent carboxyltransferase family protein [Zunongwangia sp.]|uniref:5-oxoprolinase subunit C family protein n=1 Tax=Zunongwangia sp. TaxID=1965325 RepID=UPI003AA829A0